MADEDRIGKLFLLAMSSDSDAEALSALQMIKAALKKKGLDAHAIADALNRASSPSDADSNQLGSALRSFSEGPNAPNYWTTDWDNQTQTKEDKWQDAIYAPYGAPDSYPMSEPLEEQVRGAPFLGMPGANPWLTETDWELEAEIAEEGQAAREEQPAWAADQVADFGERASDSGSIPSDRKQSANKPKKRRRRSHRNGRPKRP